MIEFEKSTRREADAMGATRKAGFEELSKQWVPFSVSLEVFPTTD